VSTSSDITEAYAEAFDAEREVLLGEDAKLLLLKPDGGAQRYTILETLESSWSAYFSEFVGSPTFQVADDSVEFYAKAIEASHVMVSDSDNETLNNRLHEINRETTVPAGIEPFWKIRATNIGKKYVPPEP
jgi:hypothetical protein